jgi:hypothetical protein
MSGESVRGGSFCFVEWATGRVVAFPSSISPARIMTEYDQVVDRATRCLTDLVHALRTALLVAVLRHATAYR